MSKHAFLLQQLLDLTDAFNRKPAVSRLQRGRHDHDCGADAARRKLLSDISERREAGDSFGRIAHALNEQGVRGEYGGRWYGTSVRNFIRRTQAEMR